MRSWRDDPRFRCPTCGRQIYLTEAEPLDRSPATAMLVAICIACRHVFTRDDWRRSHHLHGPQASHDALPGDDDDPATWGPASAGFAPPERRSALP